MEPEACIPLAGLISKETLLTRGQIVLAGDHLQLGPVLRYEGYMVKLVGRAAGRKNVTRETKIMNVKCIKNNETRFFYYVAVFVLNHMSF